MQFLGFELCYYAYCLIFLKTYMKCGFSGLIINFMCFSLIDIQCHTCIYSVHILQFAWTKFPVLFSVFNREALEKGRFSAVCPQADRRELPHFDAGIVLFLFFAILIMLVMCSRFIVHALLLPCFKQWEIMVTVTIIKSKTSF